MKKPNDKTCYLAYVDGYLACTKDHRIGTPCLLDREEDHDYEAPTN